MPGVVRSKRFANHFTTTAPYPGLLLYTCPANLTDIVKSVVIFTQAAIGDVVVVGVTSSGPQIGVLAAVTTTGLAVLDVVDLFSVMEPGDTLNVWSTAGGSFVFVHAAGAELQGVAP